MKDPGKSEAKRQAEQKKGAEKGVWEKKIRSTITFRGSRKRASETMQQKHKQTILFDYHIFRKPNTNAQFSLNKIGQW